MAQPDPPAGDSVVLIARLREMKGITPAQLDALPFGAINVDKTGVILAYNASEAQLAGRQPASVIGKNFFTDVAPCTNVEAFATKFHRGVAAGRLNVVFPFTFTFPAGPLNVWITLYYEPRAPSAWIFVERKSPATRQ
jgi:photoactive yellow protein